MAENDEKTRLEAKRQGFLYYWANEEKPPTIKRIPCEVYSRIVGYVRPVRQWNVGKKQEWKERVPYEQPASSAQLVRTVGRIEDLSNGQ